jgi:hypothetical protein
MNLLLHKIEVYSFIRRKQHFFEELQKEDDEMQRITSIPMEIDLRGGTVQVHETHSVEPVNAKNSDDTNVSNLEPSGDSMGEARQPPSENTSAMGVESQPTHVVSRKDHNGQINRH